jgi:hypothetical protein
MEKKLVKMVKIGLKFGLKLVKIRQNRQNRFKIGLKLVKIGQNWSKMAKMVEIWSKNSQKTIKNQIKKVEIVPSCEFF